MEYSVRTLVIKFENLIETYEIPAFRGAVLSKVPPELVLFHNHVGDGFRLSYPLIQYKRLGRKATIVCLGEGTDDIGAFFENADFNLRIGRRMENFTIHSINANRTIVQAWDQPFRYHLNKWIGLHGDNYPRYMHTESEVERLQMLEGILRGNILSLCKGLGIFLEREVRLSIVSRPQTNVFKFKEQWMTGFDFDFTCNVSLPPYIGLGKSVSVGFGMVTPARENS